MDLSLSLIVHVKTQAGNFWGRKFAWISRFCFYSWNLGVWHPLTAPASNLFLCKNLIFHQFAKVFLRKSFPLYGTLLLHCLQFLLNVDSNSCPPETEELSILLHVHVHVLQYIQCMTSAWYNHDIIRRWALKRIQPSLLPGVISDSFFSACGCCDPTGGESPVISSIVQLYCAINLKI